MAAIDCPVPALASVAAVPVLAYRVAVPTLALIASFPVFVSVSALYISLFSPFIAFPADSLNK